MDADLNHLLTQLDPVASSSPSALVDPLAPEAKAAYRPVGKPHRPGSAGAPLSLASTNDDLLPELPRRRFFRRH